MVRTSSDRQRLAEPLRATLPAPLTHALQPILDMHTGAVYAYEALLRGTDAAGYATIDAFFEAVHGGGETLATELALYELAFATFRRVPHVQGRKLFINIDTRLFDDPAFDAGHIARLAAQMGVPPSSVCLELSEKHDSGNALGAVDKLRALRAAGIKIALDDFGQGYSELKLLYDAAPDYVKIDRFFVSDITGDARKRLFVSTVVNLAHVLGARVVAEGVETAEEFETCRRLGCDLVQGYYVARPTRDIASMPAVYLVGQPTSEADFATAELSVLVEAGLLVVDPIVEGTAITAVVERFREAPEHIALPVVDATGEPLGFVLERDLRGYIYSQFGRDLLGNRMLPRYLSEFVRRAPVIEIETAVERILDSIASFAGAEGLLVTREHKYAGVLPAPTLFKIVNERRLTMAQDQNPLSRLPGNAAINALVLEKSEATEETRIFCYFDFNHFKAFNDVYGYRQGDRAIMLFADILRRRFDKPGDFLGHVGGDDFFTARVSDGVAAFEAVVAEVLSCFKDQVESFYDPADRALGYLKAVDRRGEDQMFPLMTCSAAILIVPARRTIESLDLFSQWIAEGKRAAKMARTNYVVCTHS